MSCVRPIHGFRAGNGKVTQVRSLSTSIPATIPCGKCIGCKAMKIRDWGIRCLHEAKMARGPSSFVTLTYANDPGSLSLLDAQNFLRRVKYAFSKERKLRYFLAGEYGDQNGRPHYHALLFGVSFPDSRPFGKNARGETLYTSVKLSELWSDNKVCLGHSTIGAVTYESALYCAKYTLKGLKEDKEIFREHGWRLPEFAIMSKHPGIGASYYARYGGEVLAHDNVVVDGKYAPAPKYYSLLNKRSVAMCHDDTLILCYCQSCVNERNRRRSSVEHRADNTDERLAVKEQLMVRAAQKKERKL